MADNALSANPRLWPVLDAPEVDHAEEGIALCLSGGGYRAMLFHLGGLIRLNEAGLLQRLDRISSVSGGSITAGALGARWAQLRFEDGTATNLDELVVAPIRALASFTIDVWSVLGGVFLPGDAAGKVARRLHDHLLGPLTLQDLPDRPRFVINATNLQSGVLWRFSRPYAWDYRVGKIGNPTFRLADAVAASAAFPPFLSPFHLNLDGHSFEPRTGDDLQKPPYTQRAELSDGGVYDNLGLETAFKRYRTILVSDGGGHSGPEPDPPDDWPRHLIHVLRVVDSQVRALRKRQLIGAYESKVRGGAYWGITTDIGRYPLADPMTAPRQLTAQLAAYPTRLAKVNADTQERLINWGYAVSDAALRAHFDPTLSPPAEYPYPAAGVGDTGAE